MNLEAKKLSTATNLIQSITEENLSKVQSLMSQFHSIWNEIGLEDTQKQQRFSDVWKHVINLIKEIIDEETAYRNELQQVIKNYENKIQELSKDLNVPANVEIEEPLIKKEEILRQELDSLTLQKQKRIKVFSDLRSEELQLCKILSEPTLNFSSNVEVPSQKDLDELNQHVIMLKKERNRRFKRFFVIKRMLTTILETTELSAETSTEKEILSIKEDSVVTLSNETLKALEDFESKLESKKAQLENEKQDLMEKLNGLWSRLKVCEEEKEMFLLKHTNCSISTINSIKQEIQRCEDIRKNNIKAYLAVIKDEISNLWVNCFISESERRLFHPFYSDDITEDVLEKLEMEAEKLRKYYESAKSIINKINKRMELWGQFLDFEIKANDPNRFKNRGGCLLQEEKQRKKLQKGLPALENEIFLEIDHFECENGKRFLYNGENFRSFVAKQWEKRLYEKENERLLRQQQHSNKDVTTPKNRFLSPIAKSAPSKLFKPKVGLTIYRTPSNSARKVLPSTACKLKSKRDIKNMLRRDSDKTSSPCLNSTTYNDFAEKLNLSSMCDYRSTVLPSKKIVGTRISTSQKRKGAYKSIRKSASNNEIGESSKMIPARPARGKLGFPFLI